MSLQKIGGIAALIEAATYLVGFALLTTLLAPTGYGSAAPDAATVVAFFAENSTVMFLWNLTIYVVNAVFLVVLAVALRERFSQRAPALAQLSMAFGTVWATLVLGAGMIANVGLAEIVRIHAGDPEAAAALWNIVHVIEDGLGGGNEIAGGVWVLLLGLAGWKSRSLPRPLSVFGLVIGVAGLSSVLPGMSDVGGAVFGLGFIVWFIWAGIVMLLGTD